jgi:hypothetical protein
MARYGSLEWVMEHIAEEIECEATDRAEAGVIEDDIDWAFAHWTYTEEVYHMYHEILRLRHENALLKDKPDFRTTG